MPTSKSGTPRNANENERWLPVVPLVGTVVAPPPKTVEEPEAPADPEIEAEVDSLIQGIHSDLRTRDPAKVVAAIKKIDDLGMGSPELRQARETLAERHGLKTAAIARRELSEHLAWVDQNLTDPIDRARAISGAFANHVDDLDPIADHDTIQAANEMFAAINGEGS
jgi:hypothetical protein